MSTAASVWPARTSTPPSRATSGKTWPGETMSSRPWSGRSATAMVCARSCAEMPVVTPSLRLDRDGEGGAVLGAVLVRHRRQAQLARALGGDRQADQAARVLGHEVDLVGRGELGRDDDVALVLPVLGVDQDVGPALAGVLDDVLDGARSGCRRLRFMLMRSPASAREIAGEHVDFQVHAVAGLQAAEGGDLPGVRDDVDAEDIVLDLVHGQRHALDGDRALRRDEAVQRPRARGSVKRCEPPSGATDSTSPTPSTWPETMWPPSSSPAFARALEIDRAADASSRPASSSPGSRRRPRRRTSRSPLSTTVRQQPAWLIEAPMSMLATVVGGLDLEPAVAVGVAHGAHAADVGDDPGEHQTRS